jgi:hypothetical protein
MSWKGLKLRAGMPCRVGQTTPSCQEVLDPPVDDFVLVDGPFAGVAGAAGVAGVGVLLGVPDGSFFAGVVESDFPSALPSDFPSDLASALPAELGALADSALRESVR